MSNYKIGDKVMFLFMNMNYVGTIMGIENNKAWISISGHETLLSVNISNIIRFIL